MPNPVIRKRLVGDSSVLDPIVFDWANVRVPANGGSVSKFTVKAVNTFIRDIRKAGIRNKIYRLNLFCGNDFTHDLSTNLGAVQVPLIKDFGNALDTTANSASTWSYAELGSGGGLQTSAGSTLSTGVIPNAAWPDITSGHIGAYVRTALNEGSQALGTQATVSPFSNIVITAGPWSDGSSYSAIHAAADANFSDSNGVGFYLGSRLSNTNTAIYKNGTSRATSSTSNVGNIVSNREIGIFAFYIGVPSAVMFCTKRLAGYTFGLGLTSSEALAFYNAWQKFQTALGRQV